MGVRDMVGMVGEAAHRQALRCPDGLTAHFIRSSYGMEVTWDRVLFPWDVP